MSQLTLLIILATVGSSSTFADQIDESEVPIRPFRFRRMDEAEALQKVAGLMSSVRSKDVGLESSKNESEGSGEFVEFSDAKFMDSSHDEQVPCFTVFPVTPAFDRIHVQIKHSPLSFMWTKLLFEHFAEMSNLRPQLGITQLDVNTTMNASAQERASGFYDRVVRNLLSVLPGIQRVRLGGGYRFESESMNLHDLIDHLANLHENFIAVVASFKRLGVDVQIPTYAVEFTIPQKVVDELSNNTLKETLVEVFHPTNSKWSREKAEIEFQTEQIATTLTVVVGSTFPKRESTFRCANVVDVPKEITYRESGFDSSAPTTTPRSPVQTGGSEECFQEVFEPGTRSLAADHLFVEDFVNLTKFVPQTQLKSLNLSVSVANSPRLSHEEFYDRAAESLKRTAPNLKSVGLYGTLRYYPLISSLYEFRNELMEIKRSIEAMSRAMSRTFDHVHWVEPPTFVFAVEKEVLKRLQGGDIVKAVDPFNYFYLDVSDGRQLVKFTTENGMTHELVLVLTAYYPHGFTPL